MIRIDAVWLAVQPIDMRAGADRLLASVVQVFGAAQAHHGYLFANARSTRIKLLVHDGFGAARKPRHYKPYSDEQLSLIFEPRQYLAFNRYADYFWAPLLALHTGARLGELVTLSLDAIKQQAGTGIWFLTIADDDAKNSNSQLTVPIFRHLVRLGYISYVRHLRRIGATELFPHRDMNTSTAHLPPVRCCS